MGHETAPCVAGALVSDQLELALELSIAHREVHEKLGAPHHDYYPTDGQYYRIGRKGVIGVFGNHVHTFIHPDDMARGTRDAIRLYQSLLDQGRKVILPVYFCNWRSMMAIKKLGSTLIGVDEDSFLHYELKELAPKYRPILKPEKDCGKKSPEAAESTTNSRRPVKNSS